MAHLIDEVRARILYANCSFADLAFFCEALLILEPRLSDNFSASTNTASELMTSLVHQLSKTSNIDGAMGALSKCIEDDVRKLIEVELPFPIVQWDVQSSLFNFSKDSINILSGLDLHAPDPYIAVVNNFPDPFSNMTWEAFCPDSSDEVEYGIKKGIYFRRDKTSPIFSELLLAHELIHHYAGQKNSELLGRGLEDGLAELIGSLFLGSTIFGKKVACNAYRYNYLQPKMDPFYQVYVDYTRIAISLLRKYGLKYIFNMISDGRSVIKRFENQVLSEGLCSIIISNNHADRISGYDDFIEYADSVVNNYVRTLVVDPFAYQVAAHCHAGSNVDSIARNIGCKKSYVDKALEKLQSEVFIILKSSNNIQCSDSEMLITNNILKYQINKNRVKALSKTLEERYG